MAQEPEKEIKPTKLLASVLPDQANIYVTLLSIIQCIALGFLAVEVKDTILKDVVVRVELGVGLDIWLLIAWGLRSFVALVVIFVVWHRYVSELQYTWPMNWLDTIIPFSMGVTEYVIIFFTNPKTMPLLGFVISIMVFEVVVLLAYVNARRKRNQKFIERLYKDFYEDHLQFASHFLDFVKKYAKDNLKSTLVIFAISLGFLVFMLRFPNLRQEIVFPVGCIVALLYREIFFGFDVSLKRDKSIGHYFK